MSVLQTRVGIEQEVADGRRIFVPLPDLKISPKPSDAAIAIPTDMSAAATAFGTLLARGIDDLQH
ncbi:hypothetical protein LJR235_004159 [Pararhizobium sp. LjRoot235]|uniref:hypothetical protein n=1 Tax=Pararhizobium sp. LjRoot235 TaxID=3342291 RepID=UPI003ECD317A